VPSVSDTITQISGGRIHTADEGQRDPTSRAVRRQRQQQVADALTAQAVQVALMGGLIERLTEVAEYFRGQTLNHTLFSGTVVFDGNGVATFSSFDVPFASVRVDAGSCSTTVVVHAAGPSDRAPVAGPGVHQVGPGGCETFPLTGNMLTLYGRAGENVSVVVRTRDTTPSSGNTGPARAGCPAGPQSVGQNTASVTLLAANPNRLGAIVVNDSTANLLLAFAATASSSAFTVKIPAAGSYTFPTPMYVGAVSGIWDAAGAGAARVTELA